MMLQASENASTDMAGDLSRLPAPGAAVRKVLLDHLSEHKIVDVREAEWYSRVRRRGDLALGSRANTYVMLQCTYHALFADTYVLYHDKAGRFLADSPSILSWIPFRHNSRLASVFDPYLLSCTVQHDA